MKSFKRTTFLFLAIIFLLLILYYSFISGVKSSYSIFYEYDASRTYGEYKDSRPIGGAKFDISKEVNYTTWLEFSQDAETVNLVIQDHKEQKIIATIPFKFGFNSLATSDNTIAMLNGPDEILIYNVKENNLEVIKLPTGYKLSLGVSFKPVIQVSKNRIFLLSNVKSEPFGNKNVILEYNLLSREFKVIVYPKPCYFFGELPPILRIIYKNNYLHWYQNREFCFTNGVYKKYVG